MSAKTNAVSVRLLLSLIPRPCLFGQRRLRRFGILLCFFSCWLAVSPAILTVGASTNQWAQPYATDGNGGVISQAMPGQIIRIFGGEKYGYVGAAGTTYVTENFTFESVTGGTVDIPENLFYIDASPDKPTIVIVSSGQQTYPFQLHSLPITFSWVSDLAASGEAVYVRAGQLNSEGKAPPIVMKMKMTIVNISGDTSIVPAYVNESATITVPVSGLPALSVNVNTATTEPSGILHPGEKATYSFQTTADGLSMDTVTFKASVPKGTTVTPGSIFPAGGAINGGAIVWSSPGSQTSFSCGFGITVTAHPGTKTAVVNYSAATSVLNKPISKSGSNKIAINNYGEGKIDYLGPSGSLDGDVGVDDKCTYRLNGWDWYGGNVTVALNGQEIGEGTEEASTGPFTVPVFTDANLESTLSAQQTGGPIDTIVTGALASTAEMVAGPVEMVNANGTVARKLTLRGKVAKGEVVPTDTASPTRLGHLELGSAGSAVVLHYLPTPGPGSDLRLVFARQGQVMVYGAVRAGSIEVVGGASVNYNKQNLTAYNTDTDPGVLHLSSSSLSQATTLSGYCYADGDRTVSGNTTLSGPIAYFAGNLTIAPGTTVSGTGTIIVIGNLTIQSGAVLNLQSSSAVALGVGGKLIIEK